MSPPSTIDLTVIAPCFNEEFNVPELARRVLGVFDRAELAGELVLVDDGSTDGTRAVIEISQESAPRPRRRVLPRRNRGIANAWRTGAAAARGDRSRSSTRICSINLKICSGCYRALYEHNVDVVQGWRSPVGRERGARYHISRGFNSHAESRVRRWSCATTRVAS